MIDCSQSQLVSDFLSGLQGWMFFAGLKAQRTSQKSFVGVLLFNIPQMFKTCKSVGSTIFTSDSFKFQNFQRVLR